MVKVDNSQRGQTNQRGGDEVMNLGPLRIGPRPLPSTYHITCDTLFSHKTFIMFQCLNV